MFSHVRVLFNSEAGKKKKKSRFKYIFHHSKNLPFRLFKDPYGLLGCPGYPGKIWKKDGCESTKSAKNTELVKFWKVCEQLQRHLIWLDEWVTWCHTRFSSVQTKCWTLKGRKKWMCSYALQGSQWPPEAWERQLSVTVDVSVIIWMQSTALIYWSGKMLDCKRNRIENNV